MEKLLRVIVLSACMLALFSCNENPASTTTGTIQGRVTNITGDTMIEGALITTIPPTSAVSSDAQGRYYISSVPPGQYSVAASKSGYSQGSANVTVVAGGTTTADIHLDWLDGIDSLIFSENFDALNNGALNGQNSWSGQNFPVVETTVKYAGAKAISVTPIGSNSVCSRAFMLTQKGQCSFYFRAHELTKYTGVQFFENGNANFMVYSEVDENNIAVYDFVLSEKIFTLKMGYSVDTWYKIDLQWDSFTKTVRARIDDGTWTGWYSVSSGNLINGINSLGFFAWVGQNSGTSYFDELKVYRLK
jgi:hypothetical protein